MIKKLNKYFEEVLCTFFLGVVFISVITFMYGFYLYWKSNNSLVIYPTVAMLAILLYPKKNINIYNQLHPWAHIYGGISSIILALYY